MRWIWFCVLLETYRGSYDDVSVKSRLSLMDPKCASVLSVGIHGRPGGCHLCV